MQTVLVGPRDSTRLAGRGDRQAHLLVGHAGGVELEDGGRNEVRPPGVSGDRNGAVLAVPVAGAPVAMGPRVVCRVLR